VSYDRFDVILVLFPFTDKKAHKQRPSIVLSDMSFGRAHGHSIAAMVTTAGTTTWPSDLPIADYTQAGLFSPSVARAKIFTVSHDLVPGKVGSLTGADAARFAAWASKLMVGA